MNECQLKAQACSQAQGQAIRGGVLGEDCARRERTARECLEHERDEAVKRAAAIMAKINAFDQQYGKSMLEMSETAFRQKFSLDIWGPF